MSVVWLNADVLEKIIDVYIDKYEYIDRYGNTEAIVCNNMSARRHAKHFFLTCESLSKIRRRERYHDHLSEMPYRLVSGYLC